MPANISTYRTCVFPQIYVHVVHAHQIVPALKLHSHNDGEHDQLILHGIGMVVVAVVSFWKESQLFAYMYTYNRGPHTFVDLVFFYNVLHVYY